MAIRLYNNRGFYRTQLSNNNKTNFKQTSKDKLNSSSKTSSKEETKNSHSNSSSVSDAEKLHRMKLITSKQESLNSIMKNINSKNGISTGYQIYRKISNFTNLSFLKKDV